MWNFTTPPLSTLVFLAPPAPTISLSSLNGGSLIGERRSEELRSTPLPSPPQVSNPLGPRPPRLVRPIPGLSRGEPYHHLLVYSRPTINHMPATDTTSIRLQSSEFRSGQQCRAQCSDGVVPEQRRQQKFSNRNKISSSNPKLHASPRGCSIGPEDGWLDRGYRVGPMSLPTPCGATTL